MYTIYSNSRYEDTSIYVNAANRADRGQLAPPSAAGDIVSAAMGGGGGGGAVDGSVEGAEHFWMFILTHLTAIYCFGVFAPPYPPPHTHTLLAVHA